MNAEIKFLLRNNAAAAKLRDVDELELMRKLYRDTLNLMLKRGYAPDAASLNAEAARWAERAYGPCPTAPLTRGAWYTLGLGLALAQAEYDDPNLDINPQ